MDLKELKEKSPVELLAYAEELDVENDTPYFNLPIKLNGKTYSEITVNRISEYLYVVIPASVLPKDTATATITIDKGAKAVANSGWNGIRFKNDITIIGDTIWKR